MVARETQGTAFYSTKVWKLSKLGSSIKHFISSHLYKILQVALNDGFPNILLLNHFNTKCFFAKKRLYIQATPTANGMQPLLKKKSNFITFIVFQKSPQEKNGN